MIHTTVRIRYGSLVQSLTLCVFLAFIFSCSDGGGGSDGKSSSGSGSLSFGLAVQEDSNSQVSNLAPTQATSSVDCDEDNIQLILAEVYDKDGISVAGGEEWDCDSPDHKGTIENVPAGEVLEVVVRTIGFGSEDYNKRGEIKGITVLPGETKDVGTVVLWPLKPPPAVTDLTVTENIEERIRLDWSDVGSQDGYCSEDGYDIWRRTEGDGSFSKIDWNEANITTYEDFKPCTPRGEEPQRYCYYVVAWNKTNEQGSLQLSDPSETVCGSTDVCSENKPYPVTNLTATKGDHQDRIILTWEWYDTESINGFRISRGTNPTDPSTWTVLEEAYTPTSRRYEDIGHNCTPRGEDPQSFWYEVVAHNTIGDSADNPTDSGYTSDCPIFTFDTDNEGWRLVGLYSSESEPLGSDYFNDDNAPWLYHKDGVIGAGPGFVDFDMPPDPDGGLFLYWTLNSPDLSGESQWQGITGLSYDITGQIMTCEAGGLVYPQAILYISNQDGDEDWLFPRGIPYILIGESGSWETKTFTFELPEGYILRDIRIRVWFDGANEDSYYPYYPSYNGYILIDNVTGLTD